MNRQFHAPAPDRLWLSDFTYVATWAGFVYVAVIDAYRRDIAPGLVRDGGDLGTLGHPLSQRKAARSL